MFAERKVIDNLEIKAQRSTGTVAFCVEDKLGSHWQLLPISQNDRAAKKTAKCWKYRQCLQGNFFSIVPPMLGTGANFGCSAFCYTLFRLIETSKLDARIDRIVQQTDGGCDNVTWVTHAVHYMLVREGAFNQIDWVRLKPGHSHNKQACACLVLFSFAIDRTFSAVNSVFYPTKGVGPGYQRFPTAWNTLTAAWRCCGNLQTLTSRTGLMDAKERFWRYMWNPTMVDPNDQGNKVRVTYKTNLTDRATNTQAEFKPLLPAASATAQKATDPLGIKFMVAHPSIDTDPGVEMWKGEVEDDGESSADNSWNCEKVEKDALKMAQVHNFSAEQETVKESELAHEGDLTSRHISP
eukprot:2488642-Pleurochrysis_carterae.AAC.1